MSTGYRVPPPPYVNPKATVSAHNANATLTVASMGLQHTNTGAGNIVLTLPAANACGGSSFRVQLTAAQTVQLLPATTEKIYLGGSGAANKYCQIAGVIGNFADVYSDGVDWMVTNYSGVLTKEA